MFSLYLCGYDVESNFRIIKGVGNGNSVVITVRWSSNVMPNLLYLYLISSTHFPCDSSIGSRFINQQLLQFITSNQDLDKLNVLTLCSALLISYIDYLIALCFFLSKPCCQVCS